MITNYIKYNESLRDQMTSKSDEDVLNIFKNSDINKKRFLLFKLYKVHFNNKESFLHFIKIRLGISDWNRIMKSVSPLGISHSYTTPHTIIYEILKKREIEKLFILLLKMGKQNESIKDKMTPKSEDELQEGMEWIFGKINVLYSPAKYDEYSLGMLMNKIISANYDQSDIFNNLLDFDNNCKPFPYFQEMIDEWVKDKFPDWDENDYDLFMDGLTYDGFYI